MNRKMFLLLAALAVLAFTGCVGGKSVDPAERGGSLVGVWLVVGWPGGFGGMLRSAKESLEDFDEVVLFTEENVSLLERSGNGTWGAILGINKLRYKVLTDSTIRITGMPDGYSDGDGVHILTFTIMGDSLILFNFMPTVATVPYPDNLNDVLLIRGSENDIIVVQH